MQAKEKFFYLLEEYLGEEVRISVVDYGNFTSIALYFNWRVRLLIHTKGWFEFGSYYGNYLNGTIGQI